MLSNCMTWQRCITRNALGGKQEEIQNENVFFTKFDNIFTFSSHAEYVKRESNVLFGGDILLTMVNIFP